MFFLSRQQYSFLYLFFITLAAASLPLSKFLLSVSLISLSVLWLWDEKLLSKIKQVVSNKLVLSLLAVFIIHIIGLFYSEDIKYGWNDIKIKLPLLAMPLIMATAPGFSAKNIENILTVFSLAVFVKTVWSILNYFSGINSGMLNLREITGSLSHIRLSLMICLALFIQLHYLVKNKNNIILRIAYLLYMVAFLLFLKSVTGILLLTIVVLFSVVYFLNKRKEKKTALVLLLTILLFSGYIGIAVYRQIKDFYSVNKQINVAVLDSLSPRGNKYVFDYDMNQYENGNYVGLYICWSELEAEWNKVSKINFLDYDNKGNQIRYTIIRYLASKNLRKDKDGINALTHEDILKIENGIPNYKYDNLFSIKAKIYAILWELNELKRGGESSGHSITQRLEFWKTGAHIFSANKWIGVGTGDVQHAFDKQYETDNSFLKKEFRLRAHNQFLTIAITFGLFGLIVFIFSLVYPFLFLKEKISPVYLVFAIIIILSFISEDTLESQVGVTFYAFFNSFLLLCTASEKET